MSKRSSSSGKKGSSVPRAVSSGSASSRTSKPAAKAAVVEAPANSAPSSASKGLSITTFPEALAYLYDRVDLERVKPTSTTKHQYKLDRMRAILQKLGEPQEAVRHVHIAGTKGKGSTTEMTATCLEACGYTVGAFTSPHLVDIRERVRINRKMISQDDFARLMKVCAEAAASVVKAHGDATFFELMTALGFLHYAEQAVDVAVIEVGLGGLLDCTNVITPEVAAVTMIGYDHMQILGDTLEEIATQKGGIFKPGVPAITFDQPAPILAALKACADTVAAPFHVVGKDVEFTFRSEGAPRGSGLAQSIRATLTTERNNYEHILVPMVGEHQAWNCGLALAVLDQLSARGFACPAKKITRGMETTKLAARFELLPTSPRILLDGAHNAESIAALVKCVGQNLGYDSLVVVFGCAADKDTTAILRNLSMGADKVIFTRSSNNVRAANPAELARKFTEIAGKPSQVAPTFKEAMDLALRAAQRDDILCITGSFYLVGEAKQFLAERAARKR